MAAVLPVTATPGGGALTVVAKCVYGDRKEDVMRLGSIIGVKTKKYVV
jgi:hypothetical protein